MPFSCTDCAYPASLSSVGLHVHAWQRRLRLGELYIVQRTQEESAPEPFNAITCQQVVALLLDYRAGALEIETALALQKHLRACQECAAFLRTYQMTIRATRALRDADIPPALQYRVLSVLRERIQQPPPER